MADQDEGLLLGNMHIFNVIPCKTAYSMSSAWIPIFPCCWNLDMQVCEDHSYTSSAGTDQHTLDPLTNWDEMCSQLSNYPADSIISCVERHTIRPCSLPSSCYRLPSPFGMCFQLSHRHTCIWPSLMNALLTDAKVPVCSLGSAQYLLAAKWC